MFSPPTIRERGQVAQLMATVHQRRPEHGEAIGTIRCRCGAALTFNIQSNGLSRANCSAACGVRWVL